MSNEQRERLARGLKGARVLSVETTIELDPNPNLIPDTIHAISSTEIPAKYSLSKNDYQWLDEMNKGFIDYSPRRACYPAYKPADVGYLR